MFRLLLFLSIISSTFSHGQTLNIGEPYGWNTKSLIRTILFEKMVGFDISLIEAEDAVNDLDKSIPWRFGYKYDVDYNLDNSGAWSNMKNGRVWQLGIECESAITVNFLLSNVFIPEGARLHFYDENKTNIIGAYTSKNNREDGELGTELIYGSKIIIEYFEPNAVKNQGRFTINSVIHGYRTIDHFQAEMTKALNSSGNCNIDILCPLGVGWENQSHAVAMIVVSGNGLCSGTLMNNTLNDGTPYFLTANHCLGGSTGSWAFRFNWKSPTPSCATTELSVDPGPPYDQTANGATILVNNAGSDFALLRIDNLDVLTAQTWGLYYAGWNNNDADDGLNVSNATGIHHPSGDVMKICREEQAPYHSVESGAEVWFINQWEYGVTEPGSSGSPLFDQNGLVIGQLFGGLAACGGGGSTSNNGEYDYYGRLGVSWGLGLCDYLAPGDCNIETQGGWDPNGPTPNDNASLQSIVSPKNDICGNKITPVIRLYNLGGNALTECDITYNIDGGTNTVYHWVGNIDPFHFEDVTLGSLTLTDGAHTLNVVSSNPNGVTDTDISNDAISGSFTIVIGGVETNFVIETDCWGVETYWEVQDGTMSVIASGGNENVPPGGNQTANSSDPGAYSSNQTYNYKYCMQEGCYTFTIYDDWGDGIDGASQAGCNNSGYFAIYNEIGDSILIPMNLGFGDSESQQFCVEQVGVDKLTQNSVKVYPNPFIHEITIEGLTSLPIEKIELFDVAGRKVYSSNTNNSTIILSTSHYQNGVYTLIVEGKDWVNSIRVLKN